MATVVFDIWADAPTSNAVRGPDVVLVEFLKNNNLSTRWG